MANFLLLGSKDEARAWRTWQNALEILDHAYCNGAFVFSSSFRAICEKTYAVNLLSWVLTACTMLWPFTFIHLYYKVWRG